MNRQPEASDKDQFHRGHRERLRTRFLSSSGADFADHEILEALLFFSIPRQNTNETAHRLLDTFGSLEGVFAADYDKLIAVKGCKRSTAFLIKLVAHIVIRINRAGACERKRFKYISEVGQYLVAYFKGISEEHFTLMLFDRSMNLIGFRDLNAGSADGAAVDAVKVARIAFDKKAAAVIIAHNHLSGNTLPGSADRELTNKIDASLSAIGILLLDHVIVSGNAYSATLAHRAAKLGSSLADNDMAREALKDFYKG